MTITLRMFRTLFALALTGVAVAVWLLRAPGPDARIAAAFAGLVMAVALVASPLSDYLAIGPTPRR